jgi:glycolate oxidase iron-sulfur subunit
MSAAILPNREWANRLDRFIRWMLRAIIPYPARFTPLLRLGQLFRPLLPSFLKRSVPPRQTAAPWPTTAHARQMLVLEGCAQPAISPNINAAAARVLDRLGIRLIAASGAGCCGAASHHTSGKEQGLDFARRNIDAGGRISNPASRPSLTASGCGSHVKEYFRLSSTAPPMPPEQAHIRLTKDISEILMNEDLSKLGRGAKPELKIFHCPCSLQHAQKLNGVVEKSCATPVCWLRCRMRISAAFSGNLFDLQKHLSQQFIRNKVTAPSPAGPTPSSRLISAV